ncbi:hypothetical protein D3C85_1188310 [compost metagenome]
MVVDQLKVGEQPQMRIAVPGNQFFSVFLSITGNHVFHVLATIFTALQLLNRRSRMGATLFAEVEAGMAIGKATCPAQRGVSKRIFQMQRTDCGARGAFPLAEDLEHRHVHVVWVVAIHANLLPVAAVHGFVDHTRPDLYFANWRGIDHHVEEFLSRPQVLVEAHTLVGQTGKNEAAIAADARNLGQGMLLSLEVLVVAFWAGDPDQVALGVIGPSVIPALEALGIAALRLADLGASVATAIDQQLDLTILVTGGNDRETS